MDEYLQKIKGMFSNGTIAKIPRHVIINPFRQKTEFFNFSRKLKSLDEMIAYAISLDIKIITINLLGKEFSPEQVDEIVKYFYKLKKSELIHSNGVRVSILGKWYDLPGRAVEPIKDIIDDTKEYDRYFLNFCVNYNPHEEIADAARITAKKVEAKKMSADRIDSKEIKDNIYSSYFIPADLVIEFGKRFTGTLLFDSVGAKIYFAKSTKNLRKELEDAIKYWQK